MASFLDAIEQLTEADLKKVITIRGEQHSVIDAIERQMSHYAQHVGQIIYIAKQVTGSQWQTLSIPRGQSQNFTDAMVKNINKENRSCFSLRFFDFYEKYS